MLDLLVNKNDKTVCWRKLTTNDREEVERLAWEVFTPAEPLCVSLNLYQISSSKSPILSDANACLVQGVSVGAYDEANKNRLCAMSLLQIHDPAKCNGENSGTTGNEPEIPFFLLSRLLDKASHYVEKFIGKKKYLSIDISTVEKEYCKMGIMTSLRKKVETIAREQQCQYIISISTSKFTQIIAEKLGYKQLKEIMYSDYVDKVTGTKPFDGNMSAIHTSVKIMCLDLNENES